MVKKGTCGLCQGGCAVVYTIENGKIVKAEPDKESPKGRLCPRGALVPDILYGEERIKRPLIRVGERGEGKFRECSWEEAVDKAAELLKKTADTYGGRSLASYYGRGILGLPVTRLCGKGDGSGKGKFLINLGSVNDMNCSSICNLASSSVTPRTLMGLNTRMMVQEIEESDYIISWGKNSASDDGPQVMLHRIKEAQKRGAKLIVIDPRQEGLGKIADWWIPITPGSDGALALAMLKLIIGSGRYDHEFIEKYTRGFEEFKAYLDTQTMEQLSKWCGISVTDIEKLTDIFCSTAKIPLVAYTGLEYQLSAIQNNRAIFVLWAITGKLDAPGAIYLNAKGLETPKLFEIPEDDKPIGADEFPLFYKFSGLGQFSRFPKAVLEDEPYPVRGLMILGGSPVLSFPDSKSWREAYKKLDCLIVLDRYFTEDARYADVVFPACSLFEVPKAVPGPEGPHIVEPLIEPVGESKNDVLIMGAIAKKLGFGDKLPQTEEELRSWLLSGTAPYAGDFGTSADQKKEKHYKKYETGELRADGKPGFPTPSGKLEICSTILEENGFVPYPEYKDVRSIPELAGKEYPFTMTSGARSNNRMGVFGANLDKIAEIEPYPFVDINAEDAKEIGIEDGDMVKVITPFADGTFKAKIRGIARHAIHIPHGGGSAYMAEPWKNGNVNDLCSLDYADPMTGFVLIKSVPCRVEKV